MLQHDYLLEIIQKFIEVVQEALGLAVLEHDADAIQLVEEQVAELVQLSPETAMSLAPGSLVTMMQLANTPDSLAHYAAYALARLSEAYDGLGEHDTAMLRRGQADALAAAFECSADEVPEGLGGLDARIRPGASLGAGAS